MKFIVLIVVSIAVFSVSCRERPNGRKLSNDGRVQNERKLRGGSKCKSDIVCSLLGGSCVNNSTYCSGREVPSVCSGPKCKCCIPVNLEVKMHELETEVRSLAVNITIANFNLNTKLDSMMDFIISANSSQATVNSNLDLKMNSLISTNSNLTIANSNLDLKIDSIMSTNSNLTIANSNLDLKIDSIISSNSNLTIANANQDSKLDSIKEQQGCPEGFFMLPLSMQCLKFFNDRSRSWDQADAKCRDEGLQLAKPYEMISLSHYLVTRYGNNAHTWLGARGDGSSMVWRRDNQRITSNNALWWPSHPGGVTTNHCLELWACENCWKTNPEKPLTAHGCSRAIFTLCELV